MKRKEANTENDGKNVKNEKNVKNGKIGKIASAVVCVLIAVVIIAQIALSGKKSDYTTEIALSEKITESLDVEMFIVRDEKIITSPSSANVVSAVDDGTRVSSGDTVAYSFADSASAANVTRLKEVEQLLDYYNNLSSKQNVTVSDTASYDDRIVESMCSFSSAVASGDLSSLSDELDEMRDAVTSKQTATGVELDLSSTIAALTSEYSSLQSASSAYTAITADSPGYYIQGTDGYENALSYADVDSWTIEDAQNAISSEKTSATSAVGRIVRGYYWYMVCVVDMQDVEDLSEGDRRTVSFPDSPVGDVTARVYAMKTDSATKKTLVILRCNEMSADIASLRREDAKINLATYEGYRVDNDAIRVNEDGEKGVYVISGSVIRFKKVNIVYSTEDYSIAADPDPDDENIDSLSGYISLYDEYITSGKDLYDGKLVK